MKKKTIIGIASMMLVALLMCACAGNVTPNTEPTPLPEQTPATDATDAPEATDMPENTDIPAEGPRGYYEINEDNTEIKVYLEKAQGEWSFEECPNLNIKAEEDEEGYAVFTISGKAADTCKVKFICSKDGAVVCESNMEVFVNEAMYVEVISADIKTKEAK